MILICIETTEDYCVAICLRFDLMFEGTTKNRLDISLILSVATANQCYKPNPNICFSAMMLSTSWLSQLGWRSTRMDQWSCMYHVVKLAINNADRQNPLLASCTKRVFRGALKITDRVLAAWQEHAEVFVVLRSLLYMWRQSHKGEEVTSSFGYPKMSFIVLKQVEPPI